MNGFKFLQQHLVHTQKKGMTIIVYAISEWSLCLIGD